MRGSWALAALALIACPTAAWAGQTCDQQIAHAGHILTGMFIRQPDGLTEINGFPLVGSGQGVAYANCPVIAVDGAEATSCSLGILERQGELMLPVQVSGIEGCIGGDAQVADCPDFTAEGFGVNNGGRLAEVLKRNRDQICARFGDKPVVTLASVPAPGETVPGLDGSSFFEIMPDCATLGAGAGCVAAAEAAQGEVAGVTRVTAGGERLACAVAVDGALLACGAAD